MSRCSLVLAAWLCAHAHAHALDALCQEPASTTNLLLADDTANPTNTTPRADAALLAASSESEGEVPWCTHAADPRCAPVDSHHAAIELARSGALHAASALGVTPPPFRTRPKSPVLDRSDARPGHGRRIERPPQPAWCG